MIELNGVIYPNLITSKATETEMKCVHIAQCKRVSNYLIIIILLTSFSGEIVTKFETHVHSAQFTFTPQKYRIFESERCNKYEAHLSQLQFLSCLPPTLPLLLSLPV